MSEPPTPNAVNDRVRQIGGPRSRRLLLCLAQQDDALTAALQERGYRCIVTGDPARCHFKALQRDHDAVILDSRASADHAVGLCRQLRNVSRYADTPLFVAVDEARGDLLDQLTDAGADDVFTGTLDAERVHMRVDSYLRRVERVNRERALRRELSRYVSRRTCDFVSRSMHTGEEVPPVEAQVCVMFADVRGSTELSREARLPTLFSMLSRLLAAQVECVDRHDGYVDKFGGDGFMAVFDGPDMADNACRCALEIIDQSRNGPQNPGGPPVLPVGVGLNLGTVLMGNIGSSEHRDFSVLGETVNVASRLCAEAEGGAVLVGEALRARIRDGQALEFSSPLSVSVKGIERPVTAYRLVRDDSLATSSGVFSAGVFDRRGLGVR